MNREIRTQMRPWTEGHVGPGARKGRSRRQKATIVVPAVDTYRTHMDHVQMLYTRLRLADDPEQQSSVTSTVLPPLPLYAMKRSHTFAGTQSRSPRESSDPRVNKPLPYKSLLEFSSMTGSVSHRPSSLHSSSVESLISSKLSHTNELQNTEDSSVSHHNKASRQHNYSHHRLPRKSFRRTPKANPPPPPPREESWADESYDQRTISRDASPNGEIEDSLRHEESHISEHDDATELRGFHEDLLSDEHAKTRTNPETDDDVDTLRENLQSPEYVIYTEDDPLASQHPHNGSQTVHYPDDVSENLGQHSGQRNGWANPDSREHQIRSTGAISRTRKASREVGASSSEVSSKDSSCYEADGSVGPPGTSGGEYAATRFAHKQHKDDLKRRAQHNGEEEERKRVKHKRDIRRKAEHPEDHAEHRKDSTPRGEDHDNEHQSGRQSENTDQTDIEETHLLSSDDQQVDILQLCEHLKTHGLGDPIMSTQCHLRTRFSNSLPPGVKARCLPRNPSKREKIKGRARLDYELANMRAEAFCEQQRPKAFRTASADLKDRDLRLLEEEERENLRKALDDTARGHGGAAQDANFDDEDDESSIVGSPLSREELFLRIEAWADDVYDALCGSHS